MAAVYTLQEMMNGEFPQLSVQENVVGHFEFETGASC
jgi:hypothetical protein